MLADTGSSTDAACVLAFATWAERVAPAILASSLYFAVLAHPLTSARLAEVLLYTVLTLGVCHGIDNICPAFLWSTHDFLA